MGASIVVGVSGAGAQNERRKEFRLKPYEVPETEVYRGREACEED